MSHILPNQPLIATLDGIELKVTDGTKTCNGTKVKIPKRTFF